MKTILSPELRAFNLLYKEIDNVYHEIASHYGLSDSAFVILYSIYDLGDGCLQKDICGTTFGSKQTINSSIKKLERQGYLHLSAGKGRNMHIHLTPAGTGLVTRCVLPVISMENQVFQEMTPEENQLLLNLTKKYMTKLRIGAKKLLE